MFVGEVPTVRAALRLNNVSISVPVGRGPGTPERSGGVCGAYRRASPCALALNESTARFLPGCGRSPTTPEGRHRAAWEVGVRAAYAGGR